jgi:hypothetical protein
MDSFAAFILAHLVCFTPFAGHNCPGFSMPAFNTLNIEAGLPTVASPQEVRPGHARYFWRKMECV